MLCPSYWTHAPSILAFKWLIMYVYTDGLCCVTSCDSAKWTIHGLWPNYDKGGYPVRWLPYTSTPSLLFEHACVAPCTTVALCMMGACSVIEYVASRQACQSLNCHVQVNCPGVPKYQSEDISGLEDELDDVWPSYKGEMACIRSFKMITMSWRVYLLCMHACSS